MKCWKKRKYEVVWTKEHVRIGGMDGNEAKEVFKHRKMWRKVVHGGGMQIKKLLGVALVIASYIEPRCRL